MTMARNDDFFLRKWVEYYGRELGLENLYVYLDGKDQPRPAWCPESVNVEICEKIPGKVVQLDRLRLRFLSDQAAILLKKYDMVIGTDADEFLIPDPASHQLGQQITGRQQIGSEKRALLRILLSKAEPAEMLI